MSRSTRKDRGTGAGAARNQVRRSPYLVTRQPTVDTAGFGPLAFDDVVETLLTAPEVYVERVIEPASLALLALTPAPLQQVVVAHMSPERAAELDRSHPQLLVEPDALLLPSPVPLPGPATIDPAALQPFGTATSWTISVVGPDGTPVPGAAVYLYGAGVPAQGRTDDTGTVTLSLVNESDDTVRSVYVNPRSAFWDLWIDEPGLVSGEVSTIELLPLSSSFAGFPATQLLGWGQRAMRLDQLGTDVTGAGVRVAVVDSGAAVTHPDLAGITRGRDLTVLPADDLGWTNDTIAHGSHCSGVIAGADDAAGIRGFAPGAEVRELRIFPGGRFSVLLDALDHCIDQQVDIVNLSLGSPSGSLAMTQKLQQAKEAGVACIVAAGNSGGPVQFPGVSPDVLTVAAFGKQGEFPPGSFHARQVPTGTKGDRGYFPAVFSCRGPEVDVCAPGVAIVSSVPPDGYAAWDGTSMATPHVTGLAALVLAHHPDFSGPFATRDAARVDRLFEILRDSATPLDFGDPGLTGAGCPDAVRAVFGHPAPTRNGTPSGVVPARVAPAAGPGGTAAPALDRTPLPDTTGLVEPILQRLRDEFVAAGLL